ncbi:MAG TPA: hypothetical protein ENK58_00865 [Desulfobacterales bacterium]|nr:hypothetical protein [Desulfobacterales bacterium]
MSGICQSQTSVRKPKLRFRNCAPGGLANPPEMPDVRDLSIPDERPKTETALPKLRSRGIGKSPGDA